MRVVAGLVVLPFLAGCGRAAGEPARYSGRAGDSAADSARVTIAASVPDGAEILGEVVARCRADDGVVSLDSESLADVDCSEALLAAALREKAASVGGLSLVGFRCIVTPESRGRLFASELHTCSAKVATAAFAPDTGNPVARADPAFAPPYARPGEAYRVSVSLFPYDGRANGRRAISSDAVAELAFAPPGRIVVGDIVARCDGCDRAVVRHAVRAAAGRVGASDVVGVACVRDEGGWLCTGRATRPDD